MDQEVVVAILDTIAKICKAGLSILGFICQLAVARYIFQTLFRYKKEN